MFPRTPFAIAMALVVAGTAYAKSPEEAGLEVAVKADKANEGFASETAEMTMELINAHGDKVTRKMSMMIQEGDNDGDKSISEFNWPADVKGTKMLTWTHKKGDDDQWLYLPAIKRVKRISSRNKSGSFMGSEFAYEDLGSQEVEKYTYKLLGEVKLDGRDCYHMERYPVDKRSGYKKQVVWTDKQYWQPLKIEYYDRRGDLLKVASFKDYKKAGKFWRMTSLLMENVQTKKKSILTWSNRKLGAELDEDDFESDSLAD